MTGWLCQRCNSRIPWLGSHLCPNPLSEAQLIELGKRIQIVRAAKQNPKQDIVHLLNGLRMQVTISPSTRDILRDAVDEIRRLRSAASKRT